MAGASLQWPVAAALALHEPVLTLGLAWLVLGQSIALSQVAGGRVLVATVVWLGLRRPRLASEA
ncbi:MAG: hypothetical protein ABIZ57_11190 [Candidatus Limnocylindria bacterium]